MATYSAMPETLDLEFVQGDELTVELDIATNLTGYTFTAKVIKVLTLSANNKVLTYEDVFSFTQVPVNLAVGRLNLNLNETQTGSLDLSYNYRWYLRQVSPGGVTRTIRSGSAFPRNP